MYNYGSAAEVLDTVFEVIEGGKTVEAAKTAAVVADNGTKLFDVATSGVNAANGSATAVDSIVSIGEGATAGTTAGAGILAVDVGMAGAAIAPCLGVAAGYAIGTGLYNLSPSFWMDVTDKLEAAGQTVKGKVQGLLLEDGTTAFSQDTIEIFKQAFIDAGVYEETATIPIYDGSHFVYTKNGTTSLQLSQEMYNKFKAVARTSAPVAMYWSGDYEGLPRYFNNMKYQGEDLEYKINTVVSCPFASEDQIAIISFAFSKYIPTANKNLWGYDQNGQSFNQYLAAADNAYLFNYEGQSYIGFGFWSNVGKSSPHYDQFAQLIKQYFGLTVEELPVVSSWTQALNEIPKFALNLTWQGINTQPNAIYPSGVPFTQTYPDWLHIEFPDTLPVELPDYFPVSMPTPDITQDPAQEGSNQTETQLDRLIELLFQSLPDNDPLIEPDPDPSPEPEPTTEPQPDPEPNPPDPNPPVPDPIPTIPIPILDTTSADRMFTVYNPTDANVNSLGAFLWTSNVIEQIKKLWDDPMQAIISFHKIYGAPTVGSSQEIVLGYIESGVSAPVVTSQFCDVDCGSVTVPELLNNATSYAPFTSLHIYLPFIGIMELDTNECMKATLHVKYRIDVYTGTCIALIYVSRNPDLTHEQVLYTFSGNASQQLPLTSSSFGGAISALLGLAGAGVAVASGGALGVAAGAVSAAHSLTQEMVHINRSGGLSANAGILGSRTPYLILSRQYCSDANGYAGFYGYPSNKTVYIGNCNGYIKCKDVIFRGSCTQAEAEEIESLLKSGVYV